MRITSAAGTQTYTYDYGTTFGGGAGLGIITGGLYHYNIICNGATNNTPEPGCVPPRFNGNGTYSEGSQTEVKYDLPKTVNGYTFTELKPNAAQTYRLRGVKGSVRINFDYVVPNG